MVINRDGVTDSRLSSDQLLRNNRAFFSFYLEILYGCAFQVHYQPDNQCNYYDYNNCVFFISVSSNP